MFVSGKPDLTGFLKIPVLEYNWSMKKIIIDQEIFNKFPDFKRGIIIVNYIENASENKRIKRLLNKEIEEEIGKNLLEHEFVKAWDSVHLKFGSNPNQFPPSIKTLLKRIEKGGGLPFINSVVALFNYISIKYLIPCGGDDVDKIEGNLRLGFAKGDESFIPLGSEDKENPEVGEVIYFDDKTLNVMCRRWNWRNGDYTKITPETKKIIINIDGAGPVSQSLVEEARDELAKLLVEQCNGKVETSLLNKEKQEIDTEKII
jgi:DNA/RNA-binding domain of Phe-tRNA-synthetase-like protein